MSDRDAIGTFQCPDCGATGVPGEETIMRVWEDPEDYQRDCDPDWLACMDCHTMHENTVDSYPTHRQV